MVGTSNDLEMAIDLKSPPINYDTGLTRPKEFITQLNNHELAKSGCLFAIKFPMFKAQIPSNPHKSSTSPKFLNLLSPRMYLNLRLFHGTPKCTALLIIFLKHRHVQGIPISSHLWQIAPGRWPLVANDPVGQGGRGAGVVPVGKNCWVVLLWWSSAQFLATWLRENWKSNFPIFDG